MFPCCVSRVRIGRALFYRARSASTESVHVALLPSLLAPLLRCFGLFVHVSPDPENPCDRPKPTEGKRHKRPAPAGPFNAISQYAHQRRGHQNGRHQPIIHVQPQKSLHVLSLTSSIEFVQPYKGCRGWFLLCASNEHCSSLRVLRARNTPRHPSPNSPLHRRI